MADARTYHATEALVELERLGVKVRLGPNGFDLISDPPAGRMRRDAFALLTEHRDAIRAELLAPKRKRPTLDDVRRAPHLVFE